MAEEQKTENAIFDAIEPKLVRVEVIAQLFGVTVRRIQQLTQDGVIWTEVSKEDGRRRYPLVPTIQAYIQYLSDKAYGKSKAAKEVELKQQKLEAEVALKESQAELHRIKTEIATGDYISKEEVSLDYQKFFSVFKRFALQLPARLVSIVSDQIKTAEASRAEKEMTDEVARMLRAFIVAGNEPPAEEPEKPKKAKKGAKAK